MSELCLRMLEKRPEARYPDAAALGAALEAVLADADASWDVALCEEWGPDAATTVQELALNFGEWRERLRKLAEYARRPPRRGGPVALAEASTLSGTTEAEGPEETEDEEEARPAPARSQERRPWRRAVAWGGAVLVLGLLAWLAASRWRPSPEPEEQVTTPEVLSAPTMLEVGKSGQEVAPAGKPPEGGRGAAPEKAATPAPVASATHSEDSTRVKTPQQALRSQKKQQQRQSTVLEGAGRTCVLVWAAGQLACASPEPQVRPIVTTPTRMPPPAECPAGSEETMKQVGGLSIGARINAPFVIDGEDVFNQRITVHPGQPATLTIWEPWGRFPVHTRFIGQLLFGEGRVYGRFTQARTPDGLTYSVCLDLYDSSVDAKRGVVMKPGSRQDAAIIFSTVDLISVKRFE